MLLSRVNKAGVVCRDFASGLWVYTCKVNGCQVWVLDTAALSQSRLIVLEYKCTAYTWHLQIIASRTCSVIRISATPYTTQALNRPRDQDTSATTRGLVQFLRTLTRMHNYEGDYFCTNGCVVTPCSHVRVCLATVCVYVYLC